MSEHNLLICVLMSLTDWWQFHRKEGIQLAGRTFQHQVRSVIFDCDAKEKDCAVGLRLLVLTSFVVIGVTEVMCVKSLHRFRINWYAI